MRGWKVYSVVRTPPQVASPPGHWDIMARGNDPITIGTVLVPEGQLGPGGEQTVEVATFGTREALRELYEALAEGGWSMYAEQPAVNRVEDAMDCANQVLGMPERCKVCGQELPCASDRQRFSLDRERL